MPGRMGPAGRGGARRRTRRRTTAVMSSQQQAQPAQQAPQQPATMGNSPTDMLEMLQILHAQGVLTDDEYNAKKLQVVDMM